MTAREWPSSLRKPREVAEAPPKDDDDIAATEAATPMDPLAVPIEP